ncbi:hypothetical protein [Flammeovirga sp. SJP92]|uniref:hypothetical protein n=1 Tax=Flammeovirga sp. SJP92 TaxID=1775430 RepID=UPI000787880F|nr:hypothetical protein [Flammeovirga sp. SJP92]KXX69859.1 hypothetical protein AVL50_13305 [Flammeovirga sp. SJP92]
MNVLSHLPKLTNTLQSLTTPLSDVDFEVVNNQIFDTPYKKNLPVFDDNLFIDLSANSSFKINVFNSSDDFEDNENVILNENHPYKKLISNHAIIEYLIEGHLKGNANSSASKYFSLEAEGKQDITINWCRVHPNHKSTVETIANEVHSLKEIFTECKNSNFWNSFDEHEGVGFSLNGEFKGALSIDLVEVLSSILAPVFALTSCGQSNAFNVGASSEIGFSFSKKDAFNCFIKKTDDRFHITLNKQKKSSKGIGLSASVGISLAPKAIEQIESIIDDYIIDYLGDSIEKVKEKIQNNAEDIYVQAILQKIDIPALTPIEEIVDFLNDYEEKVQKAKEKVMLLLKMKLELGLEYSYRKSVMESSMLDAYVSSDILTKHISSLLKLDISDLIQEKSIEVNRYMSGKGLEISKSLSVGVKLGNWSVGRKVSHNETFIDLKHGRDVIEREVAYGLEKSISSDLSGNRNASFNLVLDIETPTPKENLSYDDLDYSLTLQNTFEDERVQDKDQKGIQRYLFSSVIWGIIEEEEYQLIIDVIWNEINASSYYKIETVFHVPPIVLKDLLLALGQKVTIEDFSKSLAVAVLPTKKVEKSNYSDNRKAFYGPLLSNMVQKQSIDSLLNSPYYKKENRTWRNKDRFINRYNPDSFFDRYKATLLSFKILNTYFDQNVPLPEDLVNSPLDQVFDRMKEVFTKTSSGKRRNNGFEERWFGHLLYSTAEQHLPDKAELIERSMVIKYENGGIEHSIIIG